MRLEVVLAVEGADGGGTTEAVTGMGKSLEVCAVVWTGLVSGSACTADNTVAVVLHHHPHLHASG